MMEKLSSDATADQNTMKQSVRIFIHDMYSKMRQNVEMECWDVEVT